MCESKYGSNMVLLLAAVLLPLAHATSDEYIEDFNSWLYTLSSSNKHVIVKRTDSMGLGLFATEAIKKGSPLITIPMDHILSKSSIHELATKYDSTPWVHLWSSVQDDNTAITIFLLRTLPHHVGHPQADGSDGIDESDPLARHFRSWLRVLPNASSFRSSPLMWPQAAQATIEPTLTRQQTSSFAREIKQEHASLRSFMSARAPTIFGATAAASSEVFGKDGRYSLHRLAWVRMIIDTRAWNLFGRKYLVPAAGMLNHVEDDEDAAWLPHLHDDGVRSRKFLDTHSVGPQTGAVVLADRSTPRGGEVYESYGDNQNTIYFGIHGFVPSINPYEAYQLVRQTPTRPPAISLIDSVSIPDASSVSAADVSSVWRLYHGVLTSFLGAMKIDERVRVFGSEVPAKLTFQSLIATLVPKSLASTRSAEDISTDGDASVPTTAAEVWRRSTPAQWVGALRGLVKVMKRASKEDWHGSRMQWRRVVAQLGANRAVRRAYTAALLDAAASLESDVAAAFSKTLEEDERLLNTRAAAGVVVGPEGTVADPPTAALQYRVSVTPPPSEPARVPYIPTVPHMGQQAFRATTCIPSLPSYPPMLLPRPPQDPQAHRCQRRRAVPHRRGRRVGRRRRVLDETTDAPPTGAHIHHGRLRGRGEVGPAPRHRAVSLWGSRWQRPAGCVRCRRHHPAVIPGYQGVELRATQQRSRRCRRRRRSCGSCDRRGGGDRW